MYGAVAKLLIEQDEVGSAIQLLEDAQAAKILKGLSPEMRAALQAQLDAQ